MIDFYNAEVQRFNTVYGNLTRKERFALVDKFINTDSTKISWTRGLKQDIGKNNTYSFMSENVVCSAYRPFTKQWGYFNKAFNDMIYQMPRIFPNAEVENIIIGVTGNGANNGFSTYIHNS